jgi:hypothetical protein
VAGLGKTSMGRASGERQLSARELADERWRSVEQSSRETEREGREEDDRDLFAVFQKFKGFTVK